LKAVFRDGSGDISMQKLAELEVQHYSIPNFDEFGAPAREDGATILSNKTLLRGGEILYSKLNCHKPRVWLVPHDDQTKVASTEFIPLTEWRPGSVDKRFVTYLIGSAVFAEYMTCFQTSVTNSHRRINPVDLWQTHVPLPPVAEQERIAAYLDASCAALDAAVAAKRRQLETLDSLRKSIIHRSVTKGLNPDAPRRASEVAWFDEIPRHWHCEHLKRFTTRIQAGMTPPTNTPEYYEDGTIPWFAPGSFDGDIDLREPRKLINELARRDGELRIFPGGTVFLVGIGATIGKIGLVSVEASCNQQLVGIVCGHRLHSRYLAYQFKIYEDVIPGVATATTLPIFDQVKTGYLRTLQPPREEQQDICDYLDAKLAESKRLVTGIESQIATLTAYRKSLIHECVTGQRRITEAEVTRSQLSEKTGQLNRKSAKKPDGWRGAQNEH
jgi:type I restriction enzyme S subunit